MHVSLSGKTGNTDFYIPTLLCQLPVKTLLDKERLICVALHKGKPKVVRVVFVISPISRALYAYSTDGLWEIYSHTKITFSNMFCCGASVCLIHV